MAAVTGGNIINNAGHQIEGSKARTYPWHGAPVAGTTYPSLLVPGDLVVDVDTRNVYEYTEPTGVPTFNRVDTV